MYMCTAVLISVCVIRKVICYKCNVIVILKDITRPAFILNIGSSDITHVYYCLITVINVKVDLIIRN